MMTDGALVYRIQPTKPVYKWSVKTAFLDRLAETYTGKNTFLIKTVEMRN